MTDLMPMVHAERRALANYLEGLSPEQWAAQSWCEKWTVQDVTGHIIAAANITAPHFFGGFIKSGFSFDKFVEGDLRQYAAGSPADVLARFTPIITSNRKPPGPAYVALGEVMAHGEDIRRALGDRGEHPKEHLRAVADAYVKTGRPLSGKRRAEGLRLRATDIDWSHGSGPEVSGPAMSLILGLTGRSKALVDCEGEGLSVLAGRA